MDVERMQAFNQRNYRIELDISFRFAGKENLEHLEWFGVFRDHRAIIQREFERQKAGENLMLLAMHNSLPVGQCWIDLERRADEQAGVLWALRVIPWLQRLGIGAELVERAESILLERGYAHADIGVEKHNTQAEALYQRLGYQRERELVESFSYRNQEGELIEVTLDQWLYRKELQALAAERYRKRARQGAFSGLSIRSSDSGAIDK